VPVAFDRQLAFGRDALGDAVHATADVRGTLSLRDANLARSDIDASPAGVASGVLVESPYSPLDPHWSQVFIRASASRVKRASQLVI